MEWLKQVGISFYTYNVTDFWDHPWLSAVLLTAVGLAALRGVIWLLVVMVRDVERSLKDPNA